MASMDARWDRPPGHASEQCFKVGHLGHQVVGWSSETPHHDLRGVQVQVLPRAPDIRFRLGPGQIGSDPIND